MSSSETFDQGLEAFRFAHEALEAEGALPVPDTGG
jgi:hypothetical protein